ncbi:MAG TPA: sugar phosphate nucleotidyltransferase [Sedimentibacter sp.]|nr:NTP transferase domain-containing protein [Sedimentibacter sp.]HOA19575.1 sugar phosphate nucleotidyltransferase [Sedimentibacter sp.]HOG62640.1 sugar phosphate nucleotidyltransferase [Sedimentibacter sp.]
MEIKDILIDENSTMIEAMNALDKTAKKILFVVKEDRLVAAITDGDIRRWILAKGSLDARVKSIANYKPLFLYEKDKALARKYMKQNLIDALPIVDENKKIITVKFLYRQDIKNKVELDCPVVIMAGGLGSRLYPYTKILPKPLIPIGEIPIAEHIINRFQQLGINNFYMIVNHKKNMIKTYFNEIAKNYKIIYIDENQPLGTGGGLSLLKGIVKETFILTNCDIIIEEDIGKIYNFHKEKNNLITMVCSLKNITIPYGVINISEDGRIEDMKEKPVLKFFTNTGMYVVESDIVNELENNKTIDFPDIIEQYKKSGGKIGIYPISEYSWMDMGQIDVLENMRRRLENEM